MAITISVAEAAQDLYSLVEQVEHGQTFLLTIGNVIVARLTGVTKTVTGAEFARKWEERPRLDPEDAEQWAQELAEDRAAVLPPAERQWDA